MTRSWTQAILLGVAALALVPASAALAQAPAAAEPSAFERDRADILAMAGNYRVRFDMRESTRWQADYTPIDPKSSGGFEVVRVIADTGRHISLQHLLVAQAADGTGPAHIIKHWRQDWDYEPARVLVYGGDGVWNWQEVPEAHRAGRWSQTVYQVDDSPRYGAWGAWVEIAGVRLDLAAAGPPRRDPQPGLRSLPVDQPPCQHARRLDSLAG